MWPAVDYEPWSATCDTLHAHTQVLGKLAVDARAARAAAPARRAAADRARLGDAAAAGARRLRRARRRRSTCTRHEAVVEHSDGRADADRARRPDRPVGEVTRDVLAAVRELGGRRRDRPDAAGGAVDGAARRGRRARDATTPARSRAYFAAATQAALVLAAFRAPYRGRSTPVNAWWGSFDLAVSLFSGRAGRPAVRRLHHAQRDGRAGGRGRLVAGRPALRQAAFYAYAHPAPEGFATARCRPAAARWDARARRVRARLGRRARRPPTRTRPRSSSPARRSGTPARSATGTRRCSTARRAPRRRSSSGSSRDVALKIRAAGAARQGRRPAGIPLVFQVVEDAAWR